MELRAWCTKSRDGKRCIMSYILETSQTHYLSVANLQILFDAGRSKACLMIDFLPLVRIGSKDYVLNTKLVKYPKTNGGIHVNCSKRHR